MASTVLDELERRAGQFELVVIDRYGSAGRALLNRLPAIREHATTLSLYPRSGGYGARTVISAAESGASLGKHDWRQKVLSEPRWQQQMAAHRSSSRAMVILSWSADALLTEAFTNRSTTWLPIPSQAQQTIENKLDLGRLLRSAGVPENLTIPSTVEATPSDTRLQQLADRWGASTLILQAAHGSGGRGTTICPVRDARGPETSVDGRVKVAPYLAGPSSNVSFLVLPPADTGGQARTYVDVCTHKGIGVTELGIHGPKSAGNCFGTRHDPTGLRQLYDALVLLGDHLHQTFGVSGLFGADVIWSEQGPRINEVNARIQGTTEVATDCQILRGEAPLLALLLADRLGIDTSTVDPVAYIARSLAWSSTKRVAPFYLKVRAPGLPDATATSITPGVHRLDGDQLRYVREGGLPSDVRDPESEVVVTNHVPPSAGLRSDEVCMLEGLTDRPLFTDAGDALAPDGRHLINALRGGVA